MAIDAVAKRLDAAKKIRDKVSLVLQFERNTYAAGVKTGVTNVYAPGIVEFVVPSQERDIEQGDVVVTVAALQSDSAGNLTDSALVLDLGDRLVYEGKKIPILRPNPVKPTGTTIIYDRLVAGVRKSA